MEQLPLGELELRLCSALTLEPGQTPTQEAKFDLGDDLLGGVPTAPFGRGSVPVLSVYSCLQEP
jgi:hypothetical protein